MTKERNKMWEIQKLPLSLTHACRKSCVKESRLSPFSVPKKSSPSSMLLSPIPVVLRNYRYIKIGGWRAKFCSHHFANFLELKGFIKI